MNTLKAERAMTPSYKLRGFADKWGFSQDKTDEGFLIDNDRTKQCLSDLTALISEGYIERTKYNELLQQRDELREALLNLWSWVHQIYDWSGVGDPPIERIEAAIKNTETK